MHRAKTRGRHTATPENSDRAVPDDPTKDDRGPQPVLGVKLTPASNRDCHGDRDLPKSCLNRTRSKGRIGKHSRTERASSAKHVAAQACLSYPIRAGMARMEILDLYEAREAWRPAAGLD